MEQEVESAFETIFIWKENEFGGHWIALPRIQHKTPKPTSHTQQPQDNQQGMYTTSTHPSTQKISRL